MNVLDKLVDLIVLIVLVSGLILVVPLVFFIVCGSFLPGVVLASLASWFLTYRFLKKEGRKTHV